MSIVITPQSKAAWTRAINKAKTLKPHVKIIGFGQFEVTGSEADKYTVTFAWNEAGELECSCTCKGHTSLDKAGQPKPKACYHCPPCASIFKQQVAERAKARLCSEGCEAPAVAGESLCPDCLQSSEESRLEITANPAALAETELVESALIECRECGEFGPEADMLGAGYNPVCQNCILFG